MELLISRRGDLVLSWNPGCGFMRFNDNTYQYSIRPAKSKSISKSIIGGKPSIPLCLSFKISFKREMSDDNTCTLFGQLLTILTKLKEDGDEIAIIAMPGYNKTDKKLKAGYDQEIPLLTCQHEQLLEIIGKHVQQLTTLGCNCEDIVYPQLTIPENWYVETTYLDVKDACITIHCHSHTRFYKFLNDNGILESTFPRW
jgi:hypothetical protein